MVRQFVEICDQESLIFVHADVHLGHPDFVEVQRQIFQGKGTFVVNFVCSNSLVKIVFDQRRMPPGTGLLLQKLACRVVSN